jgi:hypothetical protein
VSHLRPTSYIVRQLSCGLFFGPAHWDTPSVHTLERWFPMLRPISGFGVLAACLLAACSSQENTANTSPEDNSSIAAGVTSTFTANLTCDGQVSPPQANYTFGWTASASGGTIQSYSWQVWQSPDLVSFWATSGLASNPRFYKWVGTSSDGRDDYYWRVKVTLTSTTGAVSTAQRTYRFPFTCLNP